jgi:hypothetical protein
MNNFRLFTTTGCIILLLAFTLPGFTQGGQMGDHYNPDSLTIVTVSGTAIVDSFMMHPMYYLDEDGDQQADYHLNFGPYWYEPDSGNASRPRDGDPITVTGGMPDTTGMILPVIVVYEINGEFWRDPYDPLWNHMGYQHHQQGGCTGWGFGWMHDSLQVDTLSGTALVDTTFFFEHYYLDETGNGEPDYFLNFGPYWYEPPSGATRPNDGDPITIVGGVLNQPELPMVIVFEINGLVWRDSSQFGPNFGGGWIYSGMSTPQQIRAPFDPNDWMNINPGWHPGGGHHGMMPDTLFAQMLELFPQNIPNAGNQHIFAGYEIGMFAHDSSNMMWQGGCGGHIMCSSGAQFQLHYGDIQIQGFNIDENTVTAKYWDSHSNSWIEAAGAIIDPINNTVSFSESEIGNFIILTGTEMTTGISEPEQLTVDGFVLRQNYPNPFNPVTTIEFELIEQSHVVLSVYNALGQHIMTLLDEPMAPGVHQQTLDGGNLPSGIYFYQLKVGERSQVKRMELLK